MSIVFSLLRRRFRASSLSALLPLFTRKTIALSQATVTIAQENNFDVKGFKFEAEKEDLRKPRIVRVRQIYLIDP